MTKPNKCTYKRYIPHMDFPGLYQNICFRLADSLPTYVAEQLAELADVNGNGRLRAKMESMLNNGHGAYLLQDPRCAKIVQERLLYKDGEDYELIAWIVMPNHMHVLVRILEGHPMADFVQAWKSV